MCRICFLSNVLAKYQSTAAVSSPPVVLSGNYKLWVMWWQGSEQMPEVMRLCHESLLKNANGHEVVLITKDNYRNYVTLPDYVERKRAEGKISLSHFSDMIRLSLLCNYGGYWIDAALFVAHPIDFQGTLHMAKLNVLNTSICQGRWWFGIMAGDKSNRLFHYMLDCLFCYWKKYDAVVDYLMFDGFLRIAYEDIPDLHDAIEALPVFSPNLHDSRYLFNKACNQRKLDEMLANNVFLSLTWRIDYQDYTSDGSETYYKRLKDYLHRI